MSRFPSRILPGKFAIVGALFPEADRYGVLRLVMKYENNATAVFKNSGLRHTVRFRGWTK